MHTLRPHGLVASHLHAMSGPKDGGRPPRRLQGVRVEFLGKRPRGKIQVAVGIDGKVVSQSFESTDEVHCTGEWACPSSSRLHIVVKRKQFLLFTSKYARIEVPAGADDTTAQSITDQRGRVQLSLTFAGAEDAAGAEDGPLAALRAKLLAARAKVDDKRVIFDRLGKARAVIGAIQRVGEAVSDIHPAIAGAMSGIDQLMKACDNQASSRDAAVDLLDQLTAFLEIGERVPDLEARSDSIPPVKRMLELIEDITTYVCEHTSTSYGGDLLSHEYLRKIESFQGEFTKAMNNFHQAITVEVLRGVDALQREAELKKLEKLRPALNASYRSSGGDACLEGTRANLLDKMALWLDASGTASPAPLDTPMFWLNGVAGSGKSTVSKTFATTAAQRGRSVLSFFCQRDVPELSNPRRMFSTLAYSLAERHDGYRKAIVDLLGDPNKADIGSDQSPAQYRMLFKDVLDVLAPPDEPYVVTVEALDECGSHTEQEELARDLVALALLGRWFQLLVTSRKEPRIEQVFTAQGSKCMMSTINHEPNTDADIRLYVTAKMSALASRVQVTPAIIDALVARAAGLFIWCSTFFKFLENSLDPEGTLEAVLSESEEGDTGVYDELYRLYDQVLAFAIVNKADQPFVRNILELVFISSTNQPLSCDAIASFLQRRVTAVHTVIKALHAVLYEELPGPGRTHGPVRAFHNSFRDYLGQKLEDAQVSGWVSVCEVHRRMARRSLTILLDELKFNICDLQGAPILNKDIPDLQAIISTKVSPTLQYSALFWCQHLLESRPPQFAPDDDVQGMIFQLLGGVKVLFYMEVLSLLEGLDQCCVMLGQTGTALFLDDDPKHLLVFVDIVVFITTLKQAMQSVPHIYLSALPWALSQGDLAGALAPHFAHNPMISSVGDRNLWATEPVIGAGCGVLCVAFAPNGARIASGMDDGTIRLWDALTGNQLCSPLRGHSGNWVWSVAFSPSGTRIVSGADDCTLRIWDAETGAPVGAPLPGHSESVQSVAYSPDGTRIVSGSGDRTVRVWDALTGASVGEPLRGHSDTVRSVAYAPDGTRIVSGSNDRTLRIWDAETGAPIGEPLRGHSSLVLCVAYSPDSTRIVSCSRDSTVLIWDATTGEPVGNPLEGHSGAVRSVAFSPDGARVISCSNDHTVRMWNAHTGTGAPIGEPRQGHSSSVTCVAVSTSDSRIVSGSEDGTLRVWEGGPQIEDHWHSCCSKLGEDGWVRDGDKLLLWVPPRFCAELRNHCVLTIGSEELLTPVVDAEKVEMYAGRGRWTELGDLVEPQTL